MKNLNLLMIPPYKNGEKEVGQSISSHFHDHYNDNDVGSLSGASSYRSV